MRATELTYESKALESASLSLSGASSLALLLPRSTQPVSSKKETSWLPGQGEG